MLLMASEQLTCAPILVQLDEGKFSIDACDEEAPEFGVVGHLYGFWMGTPHGL